MVRQTHSGFLLVGQVPLYACAVARVLWESRSPLCGRLHRQTVKPLPAPTCVVSSSTDLFGSFDGPWRQHSFKQRQHHEDAIAARTKKTKQTSVLNFAIWDDMAVIVSVHKAARRPAKKSKNLKKQKHHFLWSHNSVGFYVRSSRPSSGKFQASLHARDDVEQRPPWRTPSCNSLGNHLQQQSTTNKQ